MKTAEELLELIDAKYYEAKRMNLSRFDIKWGEWSSLMNRSLRARMKSDPSDLRLRYVFVYWSVSSQLLEEHHRSKLFGKKKKRELADQLDTIRKTIMSKEDVGELPEDELIKTLLRGIRLNEGTVS